MAERHWDHRTTSRHVYVDEVGRVIGTMTLRWTDRTYDVTAYEQKLGEFTNYVEAMAFVEKTCTEIEALRAAELAARIAAQQRQSQADGVSP